MSQPTHWKTLLRGALKFGGVSVESNKEQPMVEDQFSEMDKKISNGYTKAKREEKTVSEKSPRKMT